MNVFFLVNVWSPESTHSTGTCNDFSMDDFLAGELIRGQLFTSKRTNTNIHIGSMFTRTHVSAHKHTHTHTFIYIYIYIHIHLRASPGVKFKRNQNMYQGWSRNNKYQQVQVNIFWLWFWPSSWWNRKQSEDRNNVEMIGTASSILEPHIQSRALRWHRSFIRWRHSFGHWLSWVW